MSLLTRRERDAAIIFGVAFGIEFLFGVFIEYGLTMYGAAVIATYIVWAPTGLYLGYRAGRRAATAVYSRVKQHRGAA